MNNNYEVDFYDEDYEIDETEDIIHTPSQIPEFEKMLLQCILHSDNFCSDAIHLIQPEYFKDSYYVHIFKKIKDFFESNQKTQFRTPRKDILKHLFSQDANFIRNFRDKIDYFYNAIDNIYDFDSIDELWLREATEKWISENAIQSKIFSIVSEIQKSKDLKYDVSKHIPELQETLNISLAPLEINDLSDFRCIERVLDDLSLGVNLIKSSSKVLTEFVGENSSIGDVCLLAGGSGKGKSVHLLSHAISYTDMGNNVLFISFELESHELVKRCIANLFKIKNQDIRTKSEENVTSLKEKIKQKHETLYQQKRGKFIYEKFNPFKVGVKQVESYMRRIERAKNIKFDVVVFDYLGRMRPSYTKPQDNQGNHVNLLAVAEEMKSFASENKVLVWTAMQLKPQTDLNETISNGDIAQATQVSFPMSFIYGFQPVKGKDLHKCYILKTRNSASTPMFVFGTQFEYQRLCDVDQSELDIDTDDINILKEFTPSHNKNISYNDYKKNSENNKNTEKTKPLFKITI